MVSVSSLETARALINLNGGEKTRILCAPSDFRWSSLQVDKLIEAYDAAQPDASLRLGGVDTLRELAIESGTAGFLVKFRDHLLQDDRQSAIEWAKTRANDDVKAWKSFREFEKKPTLTLS